MKRLQTLALAVAAVTLCLSGCAPSLMRLAPRRPAGVEPYYVDGREWLVQQHDGKSIAVMAYQTDPGMIDVALQIRNDGDQPFNVLPTNVRVVAEQASERTNLEVIDPLPYLDDMRSQRAWTVGLTAAAGAMRASSAKGATAQAVQQLDARQQTERTAQSLDASLAYLDQHLLKANTVHPGATIGGVVLARYLYGDRYVVQVAVGGSDFSFTFDRLD